MHSVHMDASLPPARAARPRPCASHDWDALRVLGPPVEYEDGLLLESRQCDVCRRSESRPVPQVVRIAPIAFDTIVIDGTEYTCLGWQPETWCTYAVFVGQRSDDLIWADSTARPGVSETNWFLRLLAIVFAVAKAAAVNGAAERIGDLVDLARMQEAA